MQNIIVSKKGGVEEDLETTCGICLAEMTFKGCCCGYASHTLCVDCFLSVFHSQCQRGGPLSCVFSRGRLHQLSFEDTNSMDEMMIRVNNLPFSIIALIDNRLLYAMPTTYDDEYEFRNNNDDLGYSHKIAKFLLYFLVILFYGINFF